MPLGNADFLPDWCVCGHGLEHITGFWFQYGCAFNLSGSSFSLIPRVSL